MIIKYYFDII